MSDEQATATDELMVTVVSEPETPVETEPAPVTPEPAPEPEPAPVVTDQVAPNAPQAPSDDAIIPMVYEGPSDFLSLPAVRLVQPGEMFPYTAALADYVAALKASGHRFRVAEAADLHE